MSRLSRREFVKLAGAAGGATLMGGTSLASPASGRSTKSGEAGGAFDITIAGYPVDHVRALADGKVPVKGCNATFQPGKIGDLNTHVFSGPKELDVSEVGLSPFMLAYANEGFRDYSLIPVFPLRLFRHKSVFINTDSGIKTPEDLKGRRVGTPGYSSTSLTWIRGFMQHEYGVQPEDVEWVVSAADSSAQAAGKVSKQERVVPEGISISVSPRCRVISFSYLSWVQDWRPPDSRPLSSIVTSTCPASEPLAYFASARPNSPSPRPPTPATYSVRAGSSM